jgi:uncharacterized protein YaaQ
MLKKNNKSLATNNGILLHDNTLFHYKIEQNDRLIDIVAQKANQLRVKVSKIDNNVHKYEEYLNEVSFFFFIKNVANREVIFE